MYAYIHICKWGMRFKGSPTARSAPSGGGGMYVCVYMYICVYIYMYIHTYVYVYIHLS